MSTRRFILPLLVLPLLVCCCSVFASNFDEVELNNVFSTYKVGEYLFVARYGGDFNNTTPVYVGNMAVSENQTLDISGYWESVSGTNASAASSNYMSNYYTILIGFGLGTGSPCIDAGSLSTIARTKDLVYNDRVINSIIDVGCCESLPEEED